jgi:hypothetical protein
MATSYLTGMELPGERALYFRLQAEFPNGPVELPSAFHQESLSEIEFPQPPVVIHS